MGEPSGVVGLPADSGCTEMQWFAYKPLTGPASQAQLLPKLSLKIWTGFRGAGQENPTNYRMSAYGY